MGWVGGGKCQDETTVVHGPGPCAWGDNELGQIKAQHIMAAKTPNSSIEDQVLQKV